MTNNRSVEYHAAAANSVNMVSGTQAAASSKHSMPFYISPALFNNRRLKQKRLKWAVAAYKYCHTPSGANKTEVPTLIINLLSDDEEEQQRQQCEQIQQQQQICYKPMLMKPISTTQPPPLVPLTAPVTANSLQPLIVYQQQTDNAHQLPHIALIPMHTLSLPKTVKPAPTMQEKRRRKTRTVKRHAVPTLINNVSIVLSDDSDVEQVPEEPASTSLPIPALPELTLTAINQTPQKQQRQTALSTEEEVTVSLVPRSSSASSATSSTTQQQLQQQQQQSPPAPTASANEGKKDIFPMLPDETTVHTVIANRIYELSLTKLREGLAQGEQSSPAATATKQKTVTSPPQPAPISLKLSSDLSISLISDEEEDDEATTNGEQARLTAEKLRRQQPQLSVQQLHVMAAAPPSSRQPPKRRKLG